MMEIPSARPPQGQNTEPDVLGSLTMVVELLLLVVLAFLYYTGPRTVALVQSETTTALSGP